MRFGLLNQCKMYNLGKNGDRTQGMDMVFPNLTNKFESTGMLTGLRALAMIAAFTLPIVANAGTQGRNIVDVVYEVGEVRLRMASTILRSAASYYASNPDISQYEGHLAFKAILGESKEFRSVLAIDENGVLHFDSFNSDPFSPPMDLSDRDYFLGSTEADAMRMIVGKPVNGRQSGEGFVPLTMAVPSTGRGNRAVVALVAPPSALLPHFEICPLCGITVFSGREAIASSRPLSDVNEAVLLGLDFSGTYGSESLRVRGVPVVIHWRKSPDTGVVYVYYEAVRDTIRY